MNYRRDIDGLRSIAVVPVVFYHAGSTLFSGGFVGVDIFFVISGFLITSIVRKEIDQNQFSIIKFYERRIRRIFPALFSVLVFSFTVGSLILLPTDLEALNRSIIATIFFISNFSFWQESGYFDAASHTKPLLHTWSLAIEEQFYLFFPPFLMLLSRLRLNVKTAIILLLAGSFFISFYGVRNHPEATFYLLPTRAWELLIGAVIAVRAIPNVQHQVIREGLGLLGMSMVLVSIFAFDHNTLFPGEAALLPCIGTALLIYSGNIENQTFVEKVLSWQPLVFVGLISYSLYLWHWPLLIFFEYYNVAALGLLQSCAVVIASFIVSIISWQFIERPFRQKNGVSRKKIFAAASISMTLILMASGAGYASAGWPQRLPKNVLTLMPSKREKSDLMSCLNDRDKRGFKEPINDCAFGAPQGSKEIVIWGDSHAPALAEVFLDKKWTEGYRIKVLSMSGCPALLGTDVSYSKSGTCKKYKNAVLDYLRNENIKYVVLVGRWSSQICGNEILLGCGLRSVPGISLSPGRRLSYLEAELLFKNSFAETLSKLERLQKKVILVYPIPEMPFDVPRKIARQVWYGRQVSDNGISVEEYRARNAFVSSYFDALPETSFIFKIKVADKYCPDRYCLVRQHGKPLYRDDSHLNEYGANFMEDLFAPIFSSKH